MPAAIPDRYRLEVRLGRDGDVEEWLATDTSLDRPVLVRSIGPESSAGRRSQFVESTGAAAKASHPHLARVFTVAEVDNGAYSISEWTGGATLADRVEARHPFDLPDFLPNATGLAGALASVHATGGAHGRIDTSAISYSGAHAAKLGAFGRPDPVDADGDVRALAAALETALTGSPPVGPPPSERVDGVPRAIDRILRSAQSGAMSAHDLELALRSAPTPRPPAPEKRATSRRLVFAAVALVALAVGLVAIGFFLAGGTALVIPTPTSTDSSTTTTTSAPITTAAPGSVSFGEPTVMDPFGEGGENDDLAAALVDGDVSSEWRTERYLDPLPLLKPGVGVTFRVTGTPGSVQLVGLTPGTEFDVLWSNARLDDPFSWDRVATATSRPASTVVKLPERADGFWLIWLRYLPVQDDETFQTSLAEVRFLP